MFDTRKKYYVDYCTVDTEILSYSNTQVDSVRTSVTVHLKTPNNIRSNIDKSNHKTSNDRYRRKSN